jgi:hypothetical protein
MVQIKGTALLDTIKAINERAGAAEFEKILAHLDAETQKIFRTRVSPSSWYPFDAFARFLEADVQETANGNEQELVKRSEIVIECQLRGIYKIFVRLGSPEFVIRRIAAVHSTYFNGVEVVPEMQGSNSASIQYIGFAKEHRIIGFAIIGFFRKALEISGAKDISVYFSVPIEAGERYCELALSWA